jgi:hypothetical protein
VAGVDRIRRAGSDSTGECHRTGKATGRCDDDGRVPLAPGEAMVIAELASVKLGVTLETVTVG